MAEAPAAEGGASVSAAIRRVNREAEDVEAEDVEAEDVEAEDDADSWQSRAPASAGAVQVLVDAGSRTYSSR